MVKIIDAQLQDWESRLKLPPLKNIELMAAYESKWANTPQLACLNLLALFPYPVTKDVLFTVLQGASTGSHQWSRRPDGLNKTLSYLLENGQPDVFKLDKALQQLDEAGFLVINPSKETDSNGTTPHAISVALYQPVADYFAKPLKNLCFDDWCCYQQHLVQCYTEMTLKESDTIQRLWLNGKKLLHSLSTTHKQRAMDDIYRTEISPLLSNLCCSNSAACHLKLHLLSGFFQQLWDKTDFCLNPEAKSYLQAEAGQALYRLNDKEAALALMECAYPVLLKENSWQAAGDVAYLLGQHTFTQDQSKSIELTRESVSLAEKQQDTKTVLQRLRSLFDIYKGNGDIHEASLIADKAQKLAQSMRPPKLVQH